VSGGGGAPPGDDRSAPARDPALAVPAGADSCRATIALPEAVRQPDPAARDGANSECFPSRL